MESAGIARCARQTSIRGSYTQSAVRQTDRGKEAFRDEGRRLAGQRRGLERRDQSPVEFRAAWPRAIGRVLLFCPARRDTRSRSASANPALRAEEVQQWTWIGVSVSQEI